MNAIISNTIKEILKQIPTFLLGFFISKNKAKETANELVKKAKSKTKQ